MISFYSLDTIITSLRRMIYHKLILFIMFLSIPALYPQECNSTLMINNEERLAVQIGGSVQWGKCLKFRLTPGKYELYLRRNINDWRLLSLDTLLITKCDSIYFFTNQERFNFYLSTVPADARVYRGEEFLGYTPLFIPGNTNGLLLTKSGYKEKYITDSTLQTGGIILLSKEDWKTEKKSFLDSKLLYILSGGIIILGSASAYTKLRADNFFEQYQAFGYEKDLRQTRKYDLISGISFGLLQLNLAYLVYNFLISDD